MMIAEKVMNIIKKEIELIPTMPMDDIIDLVRHFGSHYSQGMVAETFDYSKHSWLFIDDSKLEMDVTGLGANMLPNMQVIANG